MNPHFKIKLSTSFVDHNIESFSELHNALQTIKDNLQISQNTFEPLFYSLNELSLTLQTKLLNPNAESISLICKRLYECLDSILLSSLDASKLFSNISIDDTDVTLPDEVVGAVNIFLKDNDDIAAQSASNHMSCKEFLLNFLIPLLLALLPMIQSDYQNKLDSIESQKQYVEEFTFQEELLNLEARFFEEEKIQTEELKKQSLYQEQIIQLLKTILSKTPEEDYSSVEGALSALQQVVNLL